VVVGFWLFFAHPFCQFPFFAFNEIRCCAFWFGRAALRLLNPLPGMVNLYGVYDGLFFRYLTLSFRSFRTILFFLFCQGQLVVGFFHQLPRSSKAILAFWSDS
jgi:hypothetical protein